MKAERFFYSSHLNLKPSVNLFRFGAVDSEQRACKGTEMQDAWQLCEFAAACAKGVKACRGGRVERGHARAPTRGTYFILMRRKG